MYVEIICMSGGGGKGEGGYVFYPGAWGKGGVVFTTPIFVLLFFSVLNAFPSLTQNPTNISNQIAYTH